MKKIFLKLNIMISPVSSKTFNESNITFLIDKSKEKRGESVFQIPINHDNIITIHNDVYSISPKSNLKFNINRNGKTILLIFILQQMKI